MNFYWAITDRINKTLIFISENYGFFVYTKPDFLFMYSTIFTISLTQVITTSKRNGYPDLKVFHAYCTAFSDKMLM